MDVASKELYPFLKYLNSNTRKLNKEEWQMYDKDLTWIKLEEEKCQMHLKNLALKAKASRNAKRF